MSKGFKKVLAIGAAIAIPFAAPAILGAVAGSAAVSGIAGGAVSGFLGTAAGKVAGSAVIGGLASKATGGSFTQGAVSGGLGGFNAAGGLSGLKAGAAGATNVPGAVATNVPGAVASNVGGGTGIFSRVGNALSSMGLTDSGMLGRAATYLASGVIAKGTRPDDPIFNQYVSRLKQLEQSDNQLFQQTMQIAQQNLAEAEAIDPTGEAMRAGTQARIQTLAAGEQALENIPQSQVGLRSAQTRQYYTDAARNMAAASTQAESAARTRKAGLRTSAFQDVTVPTNRWNAAAEGERARSKDESDRAAGILATAKYITNPQVSAGGGGEGGGGGGGGSGIGEAIVDIGKGIWSGITGNKQGAT